MKTALLEFFDHNLSRSLLEPSVEFTLGNFDLGEIAASCDLLCREDFSGWRRRRGCCQGDGVFSQN